jgi:hypothetical protein
MNGDKTMQYQYVVMYDTRTEQWQVDVDTAQDLNDRLMYDELTSEWIYPDDSEYAVNREVYLAIEDQLATILAPHNLENE